MHPSLWDARQGGHPHRVVPSWQFCRVCELVDQAQKAGPPTESGGWHLTLTVNEEAR